MPDELVATIRLEALGGDSPLACILPQEVLSGVLILITNGIRDKSIERFGSCRFSTIIAKILELANFFSGPSVALIVGGGVTDSKTHWV